MEAVIFDGKEYIKASVLAEKFRYTQDYLGQLCRGKKVDARLVGRAWYINLDSLEEHRTGRYKAPTKPAEISPKKTNSNYLSRIDVEPVLKNKTVKIFKEKNGTLTEFPVRYERDEYSLIPRVNKSAVSTSIPILPAEAERLKIKKEAKKFNITDFKAEALPEVFLSGAIKVDGIPEATESLEEKTDVSSGAEITNKIKSELPSTPALKRVISVRKPAKRLPMGTHVDMRPVAVKVESEAPEVVVAPQKVLVRVSRPTTSKKPVPTVPVVSESQQINKTTPPKVQTGRREIKFSPDVVVPQNAPLKKTSRMSDVTLAILVFLCATVVSLAILVTKREVRVEGGSYADNLSFDVSNLSTFLTSFSY